MATALGVDIGNSGLRLTFLDTSAYQLGATLRLYWLPPQSQPDSPQAAQRASLADAAGQRVTRPPSAGGYTPRHRPGDSSWTSLLLDFLAANDANDMAGETTWYVGSVRRDASAVLREFILARGERLVETTFRDLPVQVDVQFPERVGIDRLLAAVAACRSLNMLAPELATSVDDEGRRCTAGSQRDLVATPNVTHAIVIQAGSAVTVDLVAKESSAAFPVFLGGAILPGVPMMLRLLGQAADLLPELDADDLLDLPPLPGKNTEQAMLCGAASSLVGGVAHLISRYREHFGADVPVILSGGDGMRLSPFVARPFQVEEHLVQRGLLEIARRSLDPPHSH